VSSVCVLCLAGRLTGKAASDGKIMKCESSGKCCIIRSRYFSHRINGFSDFVHLPDSKELEDKNTTLRKLHLFSSSGDGSD
jgi:hypothetical protein